MKIAISGLHSQGKTTLVQALKEQVPFFTSYTVLGSVGRELKKHGITVSETCSDETQLFIARLQPIRLQKNGENVLLERSTLDAVAYAKCLFDRGQLSEVVFNECIQLHLQYAPQYDFIFYLKPELPLQEEQDGRSNDRAFFEAAKEAFEYYVATYPYQNLRILSGSIAERIEQVKFALHV